MNRAERQMFETHPDATWICDAVAGTILAANAAAVSGYGFTEDQFTAMTLEDLRFPQQDPAYPAWARDPVVPMDELHRRADGSPRPVALHVVDIDFEGKAARLICARDVSRLAELERQLADSSHALAEGLRATLENMSDGLFLVGRDGRLTFVNRVAERLLGRTGQTLLGRTIMDVVPEAADTVFVQESTRALETGQAVSIEEYFAPLGRWFEMRAYPGRDGLMIYFRDVTEERLQREQLLLLESAVARLNDIVIITEAVPLDPPGPPIIYVNDAFEVHTGYTRDEVMGRNPMLLGGPGTEREELRRLVRAMAEQKPVQVEMENYRKDRTPFRVEVTGAPIFDADGRVTHFVFVLRDVTERRRSEAALAAAQEQLRQSEERFRIVAQATADVVWDWDLDSGEVWRNVGMQAVFGPGPSSGHIDEWRRRLHPHDRDRVLDAVEAAIAGDQGEWLDEYRLQRMDGGWARIKDRGSVIRDESGRALRLVGSMVDVTDQRELEEKLQRSQRLDAIGQLTGGIAHDFNNLLTVILGNSDLLADELRGDERLRLLATMTRSAAERGAELTRRLLAFARRQNLDPTMIDANELVAGMFGLLRRTLGEHIQIELRQAADLWQALVDGPQLESALLNLCLNARDAMPEGGHLEIETANVRLGEDERIHRGEIAAGEYVAITVSDSGTGMPEEIVTHAFEPFFTTKETGKGSGLGLSMVYGFVKQSSGHVRIHSTPGEGTAITLYLPRARATGAPAVAVPVRTEEVGGHERILLVEDDDVVRTFVAGQLEELGYDVVSVANGPQALRALEAGEFDLLFTDIVMPGGMNGRELADAARVMRPRLPVLFTTGYADDAIGAQGHLGSGVHVLHKPYRRAELAAKVRQVLTAPSIER